MKRMKRKEGYVIQRDSGLARLQFRMREETISVGGHIEAFGVMKDMATAGPSMTSNVPDEVGSSSLASTISSI